MAKKFGKFLLVTATAAAAAAGAYMYMQNKKKESEQDIDDSDDFDDFSEDLDASSESGERSYVPLNADSDADPMADVSTDSVEKVEEFFDDEDSSMDAI